MTDTAETGWQLVPKEPTREMIEAGDTDAAFDGEDVKAIYRAMLASAPPPPAVMPGWQDIATAPKDGAAIWVSDGFSMRVAFWANGKEFEHRGSVGGGWRDFFLASTGGAADLMFAPAYWHALPRSPKSLVAEKSQGGP